MLARQSNKVLRSTARVASITKVNPSALRSTFSSSSRSEYSNESARNSTFWTFAATGVVATGLALSQINDEQVVRADNTAVNWDAVRKDIVAILDNEKYDDGSYGPVIVRLAWHACGTYCNKTNTGGSDGATMRFAPESDHGANAGLDVARALLEFVKARHPGITYSDLWQFAAVVAIEEMGGPKIPFHPGRVDKDATGCTPDGRLPDAAQAEGHLRDIFYRMGFNDQEIVALSGAHALGRCHTSRSGFDGPWTKAPTMFSNEYFRELLENDWTVRKWSGPKQYTDPSGALMMLPTDMSLIQDPKFKVWVEKYNADEELFFKDFAKAFQKLQENGVKALAKPWYQFW